MGKLGLVLVALVLIGGCGLLALGSMATSVTASASSVASNAASIASSASLGASSVASSMAIGDAVKAVSQASMANSAANSVANFNVTAALCLGGLLGLLGLLAGGGLVSGLFRFRSGALSGGGRPEDLERLLRLARLFQSQRAVPPVDSQTPAPSLVRRALPAAQTAARPRRRRLSASDLEDLSHWMD